MVFLQPNLTILHDSLVNATNNLKLTKNGYKIEWNPVDCVKSNHQYTGIMNDKLCMYLLNMQRICPLKCS